MFPRTDGSPLALGTTTAFERQRPSVARKNRRRDNKEALLVRSPPPFAISDGTHELAPVRPQDGPSLFETTIAASAV